MRIEPPISEPVASGVEPAARDAPDPPEEPPLVKAAFHGVEVTPCRREAAMPAQENSGVFVRAWTMAPARSRRSIE